MAIRLWYVKCSGFMASSNTQIATFEILQCELKGDNLWGCTLCSSRIMKIVNSMATAMETIQIVRNCPHNEYVATCTRRIQYYLQYVIIIYAFALYANLRLKLSLSCLI